MSSIEIFAIIVFLIISILGLAGSISYAIKPLICIPIFRQVLNADFEPFVKSGKPQETGFKKTISFLASTVLGGNFMTVFIIWAAFKDHSAYAWWSLWYWPIMFAWHLVLYKKSYFSIVQLVFFLSTTMALLLNSHIAMGG